MRRFLFVLLMLMASSAMAQSDCQADYCGSVPLMGVFDDAEWNTDLFFKADGAGTYHFRLRSVPANPFTPDSFAQMYIGGEQIFGLYDLVGTLWGNVEFDGVVLLDWASYDAPLEIEVMPLLRKNNTFAGLTPSYLIAAGCHTIPVPWSGGTTTGSFQFFNKNETENQTAQVNGGEITIVPASPIGDPQFVLIEFEYSGAFAQLCIGLDQVGSGGGMNLEQPLYVLPRFEHSGDRVVTRIW